MDKSTGDFFDQDDAEATKLSDQDVREVTDWRRGTQYGEPTTFGSEPWHTDKNWWKIPNSGECNDIRSQFGTLGRLSCAATSLRGNKHRLQGGVNQDSYSVVSVISKDGEPFLVVVVCDGMGSAEYSAYAARMAANSCSKALANGVRLHGIRFFSRLENIQHGLLEHIRDDVWKYRTGTEVGAPRRRTEQVAPSDLQTTMSFAIIGPANTEDPQVAAAWIGDSPIIAIQNGMWRTVAKSGESNGLHSSASDGLMTTDEFCFWTGNLLSGDALFLGSDGVGNFLSFNESETALGNDLRRRWSRPVSQLEFVRDLSFEVQSADDDRTAIMIWML